jgi:hypothetical protein
MKLKVAYSSLSRINHTIDEQGLVMRSTRDLIFHAANRYACKSGAKFFHDYGQNKY